MPWVEDLMLTGDLRQVPIMLRSTYCMLGQGSSDKDLTGLGECPYDQVCTSFGFVT